MFSAAVPMAGWVRRSRRFKCIGVGKYDPSQRSPVDGSVRIDNVPAEFRDDGVIRRLAWRDSLAGQIVGIDHCGSCSFQQPGYGALPGSYAAGQSDYAHPRHLSDSMNTGSPSLRRIFSVPSCIPPSGSGDKKRNLRETG